jgi:Z1 domain/Type III restriction enzyme, res subunit
LAIARPLLQAIEAQWLIIGAVDYPGFVTWLKDFAEASGIADAELPDLLRRFPNRVPLASPSWQDPDAVAILRDPPDPGPLANLKNHGWITDAQASSFRLSDDVLRILLSIDDIAAARDTQENALHVLGRSNDPKNWGPENRRGLVYGMVQSGKTANMIALIALARKAGYRLFILLAGDKSSLRDQTQYRMNQAFDLRGGINSKDFTNSPTYRRDYLDSKNDYAGNFAYPERVARKQQWSTIIVIKKQKDNLQALIDDINAMKAALARESIDLGKLLPALIIDDEADNGTQNTNPKRGGSEIHNLVVRLREVVPRNTYVGYTATPQACLSADTEDIVGYPKDFFWLLEPYQPLEDGIPVPRSYLGPYEVFWERPDALIRTIGRSEWPHHERDERGRSQGIYAPRSSAPPDDEPANLVGEESRLLSDLEKGHLSSPSLRDALLDFIIGCGVRWWQAWSKLGLPSTPTVKEVDDDSRYKYHSAMIHLSMYQRNQERIQRLVEREWKECVRLFQEYKASTGGRKNEFSARWEQQCARIEAFRGPGTAPLWAEVVPFVELCISIAERPIRNPLEPGYPPYPGSHFAYLLNATDVGMELNYDPEKAFEIRTKKAAIVVGGNILSRGLTIQGLSVSVFGRTARMPLGDATMQMGRWLGHKRGELELISIYLQKGVQELFQQIALADRYLRLQVKDAILNDYGPSEILLELRNSPFFRATSSSKSRFLELDGGGLGFAGRSTWLEEPTFNVDQILENTRKIKEFEAHVKGRNELDRPAFVYRDVEPQLLIDLMKGLHCPEEAGPSTFSQYAAYLADWKKGGDGLPLMPRINVAAFTDLQRRQRIIDPLYPSTAEEARAGATSRFAKFVGGLGSLSGGGKYRGDAFLDKDADWHRSHENPRSDRVKGDDILVVFYRLHPNYLTKSLYDKSKPTPVPRSGAKSVYAQKGDALYVGKAGFDEEDLPLWTYAAWTPIGGPLYGIGVNKLIDPSKVKMRGRVKVGGETATEEGV